MKGIREGGEGVQFVKKCQRGGVAAGSEADGCDCLPVAHVASHSWTEVVWKWSRNATTARLVNQLSRRGRGQQDGNATRVTWNLYHIDFALSAVLDR